MIFEIDLLNDDELYYCLKLFEHLEFVDGSLSNPSQSQKGNKKCKTSYSGNIHGQLDAYVDDVIFRKIGKDFALVRKSMTYFSKFNRGHYYKWHYDAVPIAGIIPHYSMTCFLNDDYEGGELQLKQGDITSSHKLSPGKAIIYPTDCLHQVTEIASGTRKVFCCWLESGIKQSFMRNQYIQISKILSSIDPEQEDLYDEINLLRSNIMRECA